MSLLDCILYDDLMVEKDKEEKARRKEIADQEEAAINDHTQKILNIEAYNRAKAQKREEEALEELREIGWED